VKAPRYINMENALVPELALPQLGFRNRLAVHFIGTISQPDGARVGPCGGEREVV
jgi:hypothetical protein